MTDPVHVLYRFYSVTGQLLYVGITMNPPDRFKTHGTTKDWWIQVAGITVENYDNRADLVRAEQRAIRVERPLHNVIHNGHRKSVRLNTADRDLDDKLVALANYEQAIQYRCAVCSKPVRGKAGYVHVLGIARVHREIAAWEAANPGPILSGTALMCYPLPAHWVVHHEDCDPDPDGGEYWFDVGSADTYEKLLSWTAHLIQKDWLQHTDWSEFLYSKISDKVKACG